MTGMYEKYDIIGCDMYIEFDRLYLLLVRHPPSSREPLPEIYVFGQSKRFKKPLNHLEHSYIDAFKKYFEKSCSPTAIGDALKFLFISEFDIPDGEYEVWTTEFGRKSFTTSDDNLFRRRTDTKPFTKYPFKIHANPIKAKEIADQTDLQINRISVDSMYDDNGAPLFKRKTH